MGGYWDKHAENYNDENVKMFGNANRAIAVKTKKFCSPDSRILDIGCGTGLIISEVAQIAMSVTAIDSSEKMIEQAKQLNNNKNIDWQVGDFYSLNIGCGEYDVITAFNLLPYIENHEKLLKDIYSVLPDGGYFISANDCVGSMPIFVRLAKKIGRAFGILPERAFFNPEQLSEMMKGCGFEIEEERIVFNRTQKYFIAAKKILA